jgi:hypothetical protein
MSRDTTNRARSAFRQNQTRIISKNTRVESDDLESAVYLFGNKIIWRDNETGIIRFTFCGWNSSTTKERINGILGLGFYCKNHNLRLGDDVVSSQTVFRLVGSEVYPDRMFDNGET